MPRRPSTPRPGALARLRRRAVALSAWVAGLQSQATPPPPVVQSGTATTTSAGSHLTVQTSHQASLLWSSFNIGAGERVSFVQPSAHSIVWNHIGGAQPSQVLGRLDANGVVVLMNPAGFYFGPNAAVSAAGLVVSTAPAAPIEGSGGLLWQFNGAPPQAEIINYGALRSATGGAAFLIADRIANHGSIEAPQGQIGLQGAGTLLLSDRPDGRGLSAPVALPAQSIDQDGRLQADAGTIALHARVVNQDGWIRADSVQQENGIIELVASEDLHLGANSRISARGGEEGDSPAGTVRLRAGGTFTDTPGSRIEASARGASGTGGDVALSAPALPAIHSHLDSRGAGGSRGGRLVIDPVDIILGSSGDNTGPVGGVGAGDGPETLRLDVSSAFVGFSSITLQASRNITLASGTLWDLGASTGLQSPGSELILEAGNNITFANGSSLLAPEHWSVTLRAGRDFTQPDAIVPGTGSLTLSGNALIQSFNGRVSIAAGQSVTVGSGAIRTVGGGGIEVIAVAGSINSGTRNNGFLFRPGGYSVDPAVGSISTAAGGDVTLRAGLDVLSFLPGPGGTQTDAGSGAFGAAPGSVTVEAGRDILGHYVVANGVGTLTAGRDAGSAARALALSLISGGWSVTAARDIVLQEIRNPNGLFNNLGASTSASRHRFDYAPDAFAQLTAGNAVQLRGTALPRYADAFSQGMPPIYPGILEVRAGEGGIALGNDVILFPSRLGHLDLETTGGGPLVGLKAGDLTQIVLSDSGRNQYREFGSFGPDDHADVPLHLEDDRPTRLRVSGDMQGVLLASAKAVEIEVGGDMINSRFEAQNLRPTDGSRIQVAGDILNRSEFTTVAAGRAPDFSLFDIAYAPFATEAAGLRAILAYDTTTGTITAQGRLSGRQLELLLGLPVQVFDANGFPVVGANGEPVTRLARVLDEDVARALYDRSQDIPLNPDTGYRIGGGGRLEISARHLDLGATAGIVSQGPRANNALARIFDRGADVSIQLEGNLDMFSTTISSLSGGDLTIVSGGTVNVGSTTYRGESQSVRGIFTVDPSDILVIARGDIQLNGSRIAAYDGGHVTVRSLEGDVNAGTGGGGAVAVEKIVVDPITRAVRTYTPTIPGSGILATSFPPSLDPSFPASRNTVGDILVEAPRGDIVASAGGVVQFPLNGVGANAGTVTLRAGTRNAAGDVVHVGNIDASGSGVVGGTVRLEASGDIKGLVVARQDIDISAKQSVNVTALAQGGVNVAAGGNVSGTIIGVGSVNASGSTVDAALLSQNVSASGDVASSQVGFAQGSAANATSQATTSESDDTTQQAEAKSDEEEITRRRTTPAPKLTRTVGRVIVILPQK